ncbi:MAG TPA: class I SAM-dependent methyltransferase [Croceibacterium sp.]
MRMMHGTNDPLRRLRPRIFDTDWLVLRGMADSLERLAAQHVEAGHRVLDFGCGSMPYRRVFEARGATYLGADFGCDGEVFISAEGRIDLPADSVDVVLSVQVLEHVRDLDTYFAEIARVLKPGGSLLLSTHGTWLYHPHPEDHRRWTRMGLYNEFESRDWRVTSCDAIVGPLAWTTMIRLAGFSFALRKLPLVGTLASAGIAALMNLRAVIEEAATPSAIREDNACVYMARCEKAAA